MPLTNFFYINMPYGMKRISKNNWLVFNREYVPLGWNSKKSSGTFYDKILDENNNETPPVLTAYKGLTEKAIKKIIKDEERIQRNKEGEIEQIFFYYDGNNPLFDSKNWTKYFNILKALSSLEAKAAKI